jgi:hypothetical protein
MPNLAFWNLNGKVDAVTVAALAFEWDVDILILAENGIHNSKLATALNSGRNRFYFPDMGNSDRLTIFTRFTVTPASLIRDTFGTSIRHYQLPLGDSFLVVAVHLPSKLYMKTEDQILEATRIARYVREAEETVGHSRTVLIGDL